MRRLLPPLVVLLLAAPAAAKEPPAVTVLLHHPDDGVDPLGFPYGGSDAFTARHARHAADAGRFDYPFFVADGVLPVVALPDPERPYVSVREAYGEAVAARQAEQAPAALGLSSALVGDSVQATVAVEPIAGAPTEGWHVWVALAEDPVHYQPPAGLTNGITEHRFTVRALADLGEWTSDPEGDAGGDAAMGTTWPLDPAWRVERLLVAAWVEQSAGSARFEAGEVLQATHAPLGESVVQESKGVLAEVLSATWCEPCLYGDRAAEDLAVALGAARPLEARRASYFEAPAQPWLAAGLSLAAGLAVALLGRRPA